MHKWDRHLQPEQPAHRPVRWSEASSNEEQKELRSWRYRRSSQGIYVPSWVGQTSAQRIVEAHAILRGYGAVGGWAAAHWAGAPFHDGASMGFNAPQPVTLYVGAHGRIERRAGIQVSRERLPDSDVALVRGLRCTTPVRTAFDLARTAPNLTAATSAFDTLLECGLVKLPELDMFVHGRPGWRGIEQTRAAVRLARVGVRSPYETVIRLIWELDAGLPTLLVNAAVFDRSGCLAGIADCLDADAGVVLEYDGADHDAEPHRAADARRDRRFQSLGLVVFRIDRHMLGQSRAQLVGVLNHVRAQAMMRDTSSDTWSTSPPPGWQPPRQ